MRNLTDHIIAGDLDSPRLSIEVTDEPGKGGANFRYEINGFDTSTNTSDDSLGRVPSRAGHLVILFQNGTIKDLGINGITQEALLAIVIDRLRGFQAGQFSSPFNASALFHCEQALNDLQQRTMERIVRGVEGTCTE